ncbi:Ig-like domain-containing protein [Nostoc sp. UIC 10890]
MPNSSLNLSDLNGSNGFVINGIDAGDFSGWSVSNAGDINGDGIDDLIIGADGADPNGNIYAGESYVVFGGSSVGSTGSLNLSSLNGSNGFVINGIDARDGSGRSVSNAGDINGDGIDDLIIGARNADPNGNRDAGESYVVFGGSSVGSTGSLNLSSLNGSNGFVINGIDAYDNSGFSVSNAGDINGDGIDDLIIGAINADPNGTRDAGESYVVFGGSSVGSTGSLNLSSLNGSNGFVINGIDVLDYSGVSVSNAGDINGDGIDDLIIGAQNADSNGNRTAGKSYVVFGGSSVGSTGSLNLSSLNGSNGFVINGIDASDISGFSVSNAGDINGDGIDDLIIGAANADPNGNSLAGESYVVFGGSSVGSSGSLNLSSLNGSNGFVINGIDAYDRSGFSVSNAGDINGDGIDDLIIGARFASPNGNNNAGESYVVFGGSSVGSTGSLNLSSLNGSNGFVINGIDAGDISGNSVSKAGDINGDGIDDLIIGAPNADPNGNSNAGESYVIFGFRNNTPPDAVDDNASTNENTPLSGNVLSNDTDANNDPLTVTAVNGNASYVGNQITLASGALLTVNSNGSYTYNPNSQFESLGTGQTASDSFTYTISDGSGSDSATVNLTINGVNDAPTVANAIANQTTLEDGFFSFTVPTNTFADVDAGDSLTYTASLANDNALPSWLSFDANTRTFSGTPNDPDNGTISIKVTAKDSSNASVDDTFNLTVTPVNDAPVAGDDSASANQNTPLTLLAADLLANDTDVDSSTLSITAVSNAVNGSVTLNNSGNVVFTPTAGFTGNGSFNYTLSDGNGGTDVAMVTVAVGVNLNGTNNNDNLNGTSGNDIINGLNAQDTISGNAGDDCLVGDNGDDKLYGGTGNDKLYGGNGQDTLYGDAGNDRLEGDNGDDKLYGGDGNDSLIGGNGQDFLVGGAGNDFLDGDKGDDNLTGGIGSDIFVLEKAAGRDTITDFSLGEGDKIGLSGLNFSQLSFVGDEIRLGNQTLGILTGFDTTTLTQNNFTSV